MKYKYHELASIYPMMEIPQLMELGEDIKLNGQRVKCILYEGFVLDGRNRVEACQMFGIDPEFREHKKEHGDPLNLVISMNGPRRHLTESQKAAVAANIANLKIGQNKANSPISPMGAADRPIPEYTQKEAAEKTGASERMVRKAQKIKREAPQKFKEVIDGKKSINKALEEIRRKEEKSEDHFDKTGFAVPDGLLEDWIRAETISKSVLDKISDVKCIVENGINEGDLIFTELHNPDIAQIKSVFTTLKQLRPFAVCPKCNGIRANCDLCKQKGFLSEFRWEQCVPSEMKVERRSMN